MNSKHFYLLVILLFVAYSLASTETQEEDLHKSAENHDASPLIKKMIGRQKKIPSRSSKRFILDSVFAKYDVLREELLKRGWEENEVRDSSSFDFKWTWSYDRLNLYPGSKQIVNHFRNYDEVGTKEGLIKNLKRLQSEDPSANIHSFFPRAYLLQKQKNESESEESLFLQDFMRTANSTGRLSTEDLFPHSMDVDSVAVTSDDTSLAQPIDGSNNIWIVKPARFARGIGIKLFNDYEELQNYVNGVKNTVESDDDDNDVLPTATSSDTNSKIDFIVQKYIENPLLIQGKKFDIRQFVLVTSLNPLTIFLFDDCYLRFCTVDYSMENIKDEFAHLTNHQVQKNSENYKTSGISENQWSLEAFKRYLREDLKKGDIWDSDIRAKIENIVITAIKSWPRTGHREYSFELLGFDIMLTEDLQPYLLEINTNPGLHMLTDIVRPHHSRAQTDLLKVVIDNRDEWTKKNEVPVYSKEEQDKLFGDWKLIYKGQKEDLPIIEDEITESPQIVALKRELEKIKKALEAESN